MRIHNFGEWFAECRREWGLKQEVLAGRLGVKQIRHDMERGVLVLKSNRGEIEIGEEDTRIVRVVVTSRHNFV